MIVIHNRAQLAALGIAAGFTLALPDAACENAGRFPYALCLHGYGQNGETLLRSLGCEAAVDAARVALLLPDGQNGCFMNMAYGPAWETYLLRGLLPYTQRTFPLLGMPRLFGVGTGGWAAARLCGRYPDRFPSAVAANAQTDLPARYARGELSAMPDLEAAFGDPARLADDPPSPRTVWVNEPPAQALQRMLNEDWSTPA